MLVGVFLAFLVLLVWMVHFHLVLPADVVFAVNCFVAAAVALDLAAEFGRAEVGYLIYYAIEIINVF